MSEEAETTEETGAFDVESTSLMDGDTPTDNTDSGDSTQEDSADAQDVSGERPEFIKEAFWDADTNQPRLEALAKSQADFEKQARAKVGNLPSDASEYELQAPEGMDFTDDVIVEASREIALKHGLTKESYEGFMSDMVGVLADNAPAPFDAAAEKAKLGDRADSVIEGVVKWADNLQNIGLLSETERDAMNDLGASAEGIKALNKIRIHYTRTSDIPTQVSTDDGSMSAAEFYKEVGSERYATDVDYRKKVQEQGRRIFGTDPAGSSPRGLGV